MPKSTAAYYIPDAEGAVVRAGDHLKTINGKGKVHYFILMPFEFMD